MTDMQQEDKTEDKDDDEGFVDGDTGPLNPAGDSQNTDGTPDLKDLHRQMVEKKMQDVKEQQAEMERKVKQLEEEKMKEQLRREEEEKWRLEEEARRR